MSVGEKILSIRKQFDFSQEDFARKFSVTRQTVSNWENNKHYPDMETLMKISNEFHISFDELLKDDKKYIKNIDETIKKSNVIRKVLIILIIVLVSLPIIFFIFLHSAYQITPYEKRITTETDVILIADIYDSSPSAAITSTFNAKEFDELSEPRKKDIISSVAGRVEGDIPTVSISKRALSRVNLKFQNSNRKNISPKVNKIKIFTSCKMPVEPLARSDKKVPFSVDDGVISIFLSDFIKEDELVFSKKNKKSDEKDIWFAILEVEYSYKNKDYVSFTALAPK